MHKSIFLFLSLVFFIGIMSSCDTMGVKNARTVSRFTRDWKFQLDEQEKAQYPQYDDTDWRVLDLPHDWSIEGKFSRKHPATPGGGALPGGIGWYRKSFTLLPSDSGKQVYIDFDGIYCNSTVWINGHELGTRPNGYISFRYDLTPWLNYNETPNVLAVRVDNSKQPNSRWYSGSGIYRHVWLTICSPVHVDHWGTNFTTPIVTRDSAQVAVNTSIRNTTDQEQSVHLRTLLHNPAGKIVAKHESAVAVAPQSVQVVQQDVFITHPDLWSVENPALYTATSLIVQDGLIIDDYTTEIGIRTFAFDAEKGFTLNGEPMKILGVCNHHDLGCLGAAVNERAIERQLEILKDMGCNSIRTAHNPPAPELLDLCDRMGFLVQDETFDMWKRGKSPYDYSRYWDEWHERDLRDHVLRDRNHPSVIMWSIGNEILEQWDESGTEMTRELASIVRELDTTRPVTAACNETGPKNFLIKSGALDIFGFNYHHEDYLTFPEIYPGQKLIGSETNSSLHTRGSYDMPSDSVRIWPLRWDRPVKGNPDFTCSAYDNCRTGWGSTHKDTWQLVRDLDYVSGMYIWTGFDYLGEPTPYSWPARSSYFGLVDLSGFSKDAYYFYQSEWTHVPMLHLFPHWNWQSGQQVDVWAYTNYDSVELFLNGESLGTRIKTDSTFELVWPTTFTPGTLKAVAHKPGWPEMVQEIYTAGEPAALVLTADRQVITADGRDLCFVSVDVVDADGNSCPHADDLIQFDLNGDGSIAGVDNGLQTSHEPFKADHRKAFHGKCLCVVKAGDTSGDLVLTAEAEGLQSASVTISTK